MSKTCEMKKRMANGEGEALGANLVPGKEVPLPTSNCALCGAEVYGMCEKLKGRVFVLRMRSSEQCLIGCSFGGAAVWTD